MSFADDFNSLKKCRDVYSYCFHFTEEETEDYRDSVMCLKSHGV